MNRRGFLKRLGLGSLAALAAPATLRGMPETATRNVVAAPPLPRLPSLSAGGRTWHEPSFSHWAYPEQESLEAIAGRLAANAIAYQYDVNALLTAERLRADLAAHTFIPREPFLDFWSEPMQLAHREAELARRVAVHRSQPARLAWRDAYRARRLASRSTS